MHYHLSQNEERWVDDIPRIVDFTPRPQKRAARKAVQHIVFRRSEFGNDETFPGIQQAKGMLDNWSNLGKFRLYIRVVLNILHVFIKLVFLIYYIYIYSYISYISYIYSYQTTAGS
jgi:hypothetical protein